MTNKIITISRQFGSGGGYIGKQLSERLGIPLYDKQVLSVAAKDSGFSEEVLEYSEEMPVTSLLYSIAAGAGIHSGTMGLHSLPLGDKLFLAQFDAIKKLAQQGPCIFIGRCSDYILREEPNCINIFIHGDMDKRIERIAKEHSLTPAEAKQKITKIDKRRASYYSHYTSEKWGVAGRYDMTVNSSTLGIDKTVKLIENFIWLSE